MSTSASLIHSPVRITRLASTPSAATVAAVMPGSLVTKKQAVTMSMNATSRSTTAQSTLAAKIHSDHSLAAANSDSSGTVSTASTLTNAQTESTTVTLTLFAQTSLERLIATAAPVSLVTDAPATTSTNAAQTTLVTATPSAPTPLAATTVFVIAASRQGKTAYATTSTSVPIKLIHVA